MRTKQRIERERNFFWLPVTVYGLVMWWSSELKGENVSFENADKISIIYFSLKFPKHPRHILRPAVVGDHSHKSFIPHAVNVETK